MKNREKLALSVLAICWVTLPLFAQTSQASPASAATNAQDAVSQEGDESQEAPFKPHWSGQLALTYSNQPASGGGQVTKELGLTGTYEFSETGDSLNLGMVAGQQKVEGADSNYGSLTLGAGWTMGFFQPSVSLTLQQGAAALSSESLSATLEVQLLDGLTVGPTGGVGLESHQGPAAQIYPNTPNPDSTLEVDSGNWTVGLAISAVPWDFLSLTLTAQQETTVTFQTQNILHTTSNSLDQSDRTPSLALEALVTLVKDFQFQVSGQYGMEYYAAGTQYSPVLGKTVTFAKPTQNDFAGFTLGILYGFQ